MLDKDKVKHGYGGARARDAAAMWFLRLRENDVSEKDFAEWRHWLAEDKLHEKEFDEMVELWSAYDQLEDLPWPSEKEVKNDEVSKSPLHRSSIFAFFELLKSRQVLLVTSFLLFVGLVVYFNRVPDLQDKKWESFQTGIAEHRTVELIDGSVVVLGAKTNISVGYTAETRFISLHKGEAYFQVFKDPRRPFLVTAGQRSIRAIGTAFNVNIGAKKVSVTVVEGLVRIEPTVMEDASLRTRSVDDKPDNVQNITDVSGGHGVVYDAEGILESLPEKETKTATSWQGGRLVFIDKTLDSVIADINRYSSREIILSDDELDELRYTGTVFQNEISGWLQGLDKAFPIRVIDLGDRKMVVIARRDM